MVIQRRTIGVGAQSTLGGTTFCPEEKGMKNYQNARILHDYSFLPENYQNTRIFMIFARKIKKDSPILHDFCPKKWPNFT